MSECWVRVGPRWTILNHAQDVNIDIKDNIKMFVLFVEFCKLYPLLVWYYLLINLLGSYHRPVVPFSCWWFPRPERVLTLCLGRCPCRTSPHVRRSPSWAMICCPTFNGCSWIWVVAGGTREYGKSFVMSTDNARTTTITKLQLLLSSLSISKLFGQGSAFREESENNSHSSKEHFIHLCGVHRQVIVGSTGGQHCREALEDSISWSWKIQGR